jgi:Methyltransferase domain
MTKDRITQADLDWWLETAGNVEWTFATTYAESAPHSYVVLNRTAGLSGDDYVRAGRVIHTFGRPAKFYGMTSIYLVSPEGDLKWWTMDADVTETTLINQATTDRLYGVQNAPVTDSDASTRYDAIATSYDSSHPIVETFAAKVRAAVAELKSDYTPSILDVGCGTGRVLDLGLTTPDRYAGVDPSQPMLNQLVRKHPQVAAIYPMTIQQALAERLFTPGQFEIVTILLSGADRLDHQTLTALSTIASRGVITSRGVDISILDTRHAATRPSHG